MTRLALRTAQHLLDVLVLVLAFTVAFYARFDGALPDHMLKRLLFLAPYVAGLQFLVLYTMGVTRFAWRFIGIREARRVFLAVVLSTAVVLAMRGVSGLLLETYPWIQYALIPLGVIAIDFVLAFLGITGVRVLWRMYIESKAKRRRRLSVDAPPPARTLLVGAGRAGVLAAREIGVRPDLGLVAVGFVDDDPGKLGAVIHGVEVLGRSDDLPALVVGHDVEQILITIASATGTDIRRVVSLCERAGVPAKIIPGIVEILDGKVELSRIRPVSIADLLGRESVHLDLDLVSAFIAGRTVGVTGAGGSIGSELCRQVARLGPARILLIERAEPALFTTHRELSGAHPDLELVPVLGDVTDRPRMQAVFERHAPHVVFHAAAHKHVPLMEYNPGEAIKNNVFGTRVVADAAAAAGVETFVFISTDKAVNPTSVMGASKRVAEVYMQALARRSRTRYVAVRFGNVLGSAGSVIPIFQDQIRAGGPVTVTHPDMIRYFMTIPEASQLVVQAGAMGEGGEIFVLDMGEPVRILDLARDLIRLSGFEPDVEIPIAFSGVRPGEKLFEELGFDAECMDKTRHPKIYAGRLSPVSWDDVQLGLDALQTCTEAASRDAVLHALRVLVPELQTPADEAVACLTPPRTRTRPGVPAARPLSTPA